MINDLQEVQWAYLLDPAFELINTAGKPLTDGYIEVYIHGTRNKYYCASDFDGTLHPFKIPLDSLGANIVLASPAHSYDVYVYNKFGSLVMSRYNIQPKTGSGEIVHDDITVSSDDGSVHIVTSGQTNYDLSIQDTIDRVDIVESNITNLATSIEEISNVVTAHDVDIEDLKANKKDKQEEYVAIGGPTKTITKVEQDEDGKMSVIYEDIALPQEVPNVEITSPNGTINIASSIDIATNTKTFEIDVDGHEPDWHYWTANNSWTTLTDGAWKDINRPTMGAGKAPHSWTPEVKLGVYDAKADFTVTFHNQDNSYTVPNQIIQIGFRAKLVGKNNADAIRYVDLGAWTYDPSLYTTESYQYNFAQESLRQNFSTSKILYVPNYVGDTEFYIYYQAALLNTDGSQNVTAIDPVCRAEITYFGYHEVVGSITGTASGGTTLYAGSGIDIDDDDRINVNIGEGLTIINNNVSIDKSVVLAKDNLVAGDNITITASGDNLIISSDADVSELATKDELASAVDELQEQIDNIPTQVQSDWTEEDQSSKAYIQNKPDLSEFATKTELGSAIDELQAEINDIPTPTTYTGASGVNVDNDTISLDDPIGVIAGEGITFTASGDDIIISSNVDTSSFATKTELGSAIDELQSEINNIPAQVQSDWTEADVDDPAYIQHKPVEKALVAGENITITDIGNAIEISSTGGGASGATYTAGDGIDITNDVISVDNTIARSSDLTNLATKTELGSAIDELQSEINNIPVQVQANWNEADQNSKAYIQNKPSIPTKTSDLQNDSGFATTTDLEAYIPYAASGVELPNSNFEIGADGQAYKLGTESGTKTLAFFVPYSAVTLLETGVTYTLTVQGAIQDTYPTIRPYPSGGDDIVYDTHTFLFDSNVCKFTWPYETNVVQIRAVGVGLSASNTTLTYTKSSKEHYVLESELASAIPGVSTLVTNAELASTLEAYIPYSASGVELLNSHFEIGVDGQAYKTHDTIVTTEYAITPAASGGYVTGPITVSNGASLVITGCKPYALIWPPSTSIVTQQANSEGVATFNANETFTVDTFTIWQFDTTTEQEASITNGTLTITQSGAIVKERYVLESELASAIPEVTTYVAGEGITFTASGDDVAISTTELASGAELVAGSGINIEEVNGNVRISNDETVLWSGTLTASTDTITVSENLVNFDRIRIYWKSYERGYADEVFATSNTSPIVVGAVFVNTDGNYEKSMTRWNTSNGTTYSWAATIHGSFTGTQTNSWNNNIVPLKIVGINRISN